MLVHCVDKIFSCFMLLASVTLESPKYFQNKRLATDLVCEAGDLKEKDITGDVSTDVLQYNRIINRYIINYWLL